MMKKRILSAALAAVCILSAGACAGSAKTDSSSGTREAAATTTSETTGTTTPPATLKEEDKEAIKEIGDDLPVLENKTVKLLANFDLNPMAGKPKSVALELFETKCGGRIETEICPWDNRYDILATRIVADDAPDMFSAEDLDIVPGAVISGKFMSMDPYIDYDSDLWAPTKKLNDQFAINGKHYLGLTSTDVGVVVIYNKKTIAENGLKDPVELLEEDNWTWDTFYEMMTSFSNAAEDKYCIDGWEFENAFAVTSGVPYVDFKDGRLVNNLEHEMIYAVQEYMLNLKRNDLPAPKDKRSWTVYPEMVGSGKTLFYPQGIYVLYEPTNVSAFGDMEDIMFVPMPRCPKADEYYLPAVVKGFAIPAGAKNPEGTAAYLDCVMTCRDNEKVKEIEHDQIFNDYGWTQEMYDMFLKTRELTDAHPVFEYYKAVNDDVYDCVLNPSKESYNQAVPWSQTVGEIKYELQTYLDEANEKLAALEG